MTITAPLPNRTARNAPWWREAVVYQVYIRSFADGNGDGVGDIAGLRSRLPYLADLGVDAIWINPWYPSPMADAGYDVSDYRAVEPVFGTMAEAEAAIAEAHQLGLRVLLDIVPNHSSDQHEWFRAALAAGPGSPERARFVFRDGRGPDGALPPNDWSSRFGGPAWTRVADGRSGTCTCSRRASRTSTGPTPRCAPTSSAPCASGSTAAWTASASTSRTAWSSRTACPTTTAWSGAPGAGYVQHPAWDVDGVHDIYRSWRQVADTYADPKVFVAEAWVPDPERLVRYVRSDELHTAFNFDFLLAPWTTASLRAVIDTTLRTHDGVGAPPTWVLSNHDVIREVSRFARPQDVRMLRHIDDALDLAKDEALGRRRARAAALLMLALPGGAYVYQGGELGLPEVEDLPEHVLQDPTWEQSGRTRRGRDGCRVPLPWSGDAAPYGFGPDVAQPWLPQPLDWAGLTAAAQADDPDSTLSLYRAALRLRRELPALGDGTLQWLQTPDGVLGFTREPGFGLLVNLSEDPTPLPAGATPLLASAPLTAGGELPADVAVWFRR